MAAAAGGLLLAGCAEEEPVEEVAPVVATPAPAPPPEPIAQSAAFSVADVFANPTPYVGRTVTPEALRVAEVPSDRGFWVEEGGQRIFVVVNEPPAPAANEAMRNEPLNIQPGQTVRIREAVIQDPTFITSLPGNISEETRSILRGLPFYLVADARNINVLGSASG